MGLARLSGACIADGLFSLSTPISALASMGVWPSALADERSVH